MAKKATRYKIDKFQLYELSAHEQNLGITAYLFTLGLLFLLSFTTKNGIAILAWFLLYSTVIFTTYEAFSSLKNIFNSVNVKIESLWLMLILMIPVLGAFSYWLKNQGVKIY